jgi:hypothetical protein
MGTFGQDQQHESTIRSRDYTEEKLIGILEMSGGGHALFARWVE